MKNLIYIPAATRLEDIASQHLFSAPEPWPWHIAVNFYRSPGRTGENPSIHTFHLPLHKWPAIDLIAREFCFFENYKYLLFLDEDVHISFEDLERLFGLAQKHNTSICQASLSSSGYPTHPHLRHQPGHTGPRRVRFCEVMAPLLNSLTFFALFNKGVFRESQSGWGIDYLWGNLVENYVFDEVQMTHTRPISSNHWRMPNGLTPGQELVHVCRKFNIKR